jgi:hypothetical protein
MQCYDSTGPFHATFQRWICKDHNKTFSATTYHAGVQKEISQQPAEIPLLIFPRVLVTQAFVLMVGIYMLFLLSILTMLAGFGHLFGGLESKQNSETDTHTMG